MTKVIAVVGPTSIGKSSLAITLAKRLGTEIISTDSRLVYRGMDIGTAKPSKAELNEVKHHLIDIIDPDQTYSVAEYKDAAYELIEKISKKHGLVILCGGTGQYLWSLIENWQIPRIVPDIEYRAELQAKADEVGIQVLYEELQSINPDRAAKIDPRNTRRVIRALELIRHTHEDITKKEPPFEYLIIGLTAERKELYKRIDDRVDMMIEAGLEEEVKGLFKRYDPSLPSMSGIGYKQMIQYLSGDMTLEDAINSIKTNTHRLARMQYNWFKLEDSRIHWYDINDERYLDEVINQAQSFIR
jgi:tRNA dimethylallyltransferase